MENTEMVNQKNLRFNRDQRLLLDTIRQYLPAPSETHAGAQALISIAEQLLATYLVQQAHPDRCTVLLAVLNASAGKKRPEYTIDQARRLMRWHDSSGTYQPMMAALAPWLACETPSATIRKEATT